MQPGTARRPLCVSWSPRFKADDHSAFGFAAGTGVVLVLPFFFFVFFFGAASAGAA